MLHDAGRYNKLLNLVYTIHYIRCTALYRVTVYLVYTIYTIQGYSCIQGRSNAGIKVFTVNELGLCWVTKLYIKRFGSLARSEATPGLQTGMVTLAMYRSFLARILENSRQDPKESLPES